MENYQHSLPIRQWAEDDRPREKLIRLGKGALSDAELLAILFRSGNREHSALDLARLLLTSTGNNLIELSKLSIGELQRIKGIGEAKALSLIAALELGRRRRGAEVMKRSKITSSRDVFELMQGELAELPHEEFWILLLNRSNHVLSKRLISEGGLSATIVDPKKVFLMALDARASFLILCHNHPSGQNSPSEADIRITKRIREGGLLLDIPVLDHVIIGEDQYYSFADEGKI